MQLQFLQPLPEHPAGGDRPARRRRSHPDLPLPCFVRHCCDRRGESLSSRPKIVDDLRRTPSGADVDVGGARFGTGIHGRLDPGGRPPEQVRQRVGIPGDMA